MNSLEKRSFYSFVALYLGSSFLFILLSGFWYYWAQKNAIESETYYKLEHFADKLSGLIINAHMMGVELQLPNEEGFAYKLIKVTDHKEYKEGYFEVDGYKQIISSAPHEHLNIEYVIVQSRDYFEKIERLQLYVLSMMGIVFLLVGFISILLSKLFMKPVHARIEQIESFIQDVSHELNTPITALKMSASRAIQKEVYDKKILRNISISTKQLETIYNSLTYLNFSEKKEEPILCELKPIIERVVNYYEELSSAKKIAIVCKLEEAQLTIVESRAELLFSNLLSNAIKYSMPESTITMKLSKGEFCIKDEGVGIAEDKLDAIFQLYSRESHIAGGFGVGLSIVKQICDVYGIDLSVRSELDVGSEFVLKF